MVHATLVKGFILRPKELCPMGHRGEEEEEEFFEGVTLDVALRVLFERRLLRKARVYACGSCAIVHTIKRDAEVCCAEAA